VRLERLALVQLDHAAAVESLSLDAARTIKVLATFVVTAPNVVVVEAVDLYPPAVTSQGLPVVVTPRNVIILPYAWFPGAVTTGEVIDDDVALHQYTVRRVPAVPVPVDCGLLATGEKPAGVERFAASPPVDSIKRSATSPA
jgi:hypothetical protein